MRNRKQAGYTQGSPLYHADVTPHCQYEAMDTTGGEVKDTIDATSVVEAQQKIRSLGCTTQTRLTQIEKEED